MLDTQSNESGLQPVPSAYPVDQDVHLLDRLSVLYKHRRVMITVFLLVVIAMTVQTYTTTPLYKAQARLLIDDERSAVADFKDVDPGYRNPEPYYQTQYRILKGRDLARKAVKRLRLQHVAEFNGTQRESRGLSVLVDAVTGGVARVFGGGEASDSTTTPSESALIDAFLARVEIEPIRNSRLVDLYFISSDRDFAARAANALAEEFIQQNLDVKLQTTEKTLGWLTDELHKTQRKVEQSEQALADYRERQNALSLSETQNIVVSRLNQLNDAVLRAKTERVQKEALYNQLKSLNPETSADTFAAILQNPLIQQHKAQLGELQREKLKLSERYGEKHPEIVKLNGGIADVTSRLRSETSKAIASVANDYRSSLAEERTLAYSLEEQKRAAMDLDKKSVTYTVLEREAQSNRQVYEALLAREKELRVVSNSRANNVRLVDSAEAPKRPFAPDPRRNLFIAIVLGLALGVGAAVGIEYLDDTIKTPEDITRKLKLPFMGLVPAIRGEKLPMLSGPVPHDFGEAFRTLRTSLVFSSASEGQRIIAVTSAQPLEGKTTTACNLAQALAFGGSRVLLIDADLRRPGLHKVMGLGNEIGLSHMLVGRARAREAIQKTQDPNLWVMSAGRTPMNPSELLSSDRMKSLLTNLGTGPFDWVIVDTPPILAVTDAVIITPMVSGIVLVIGAEMTRRRLAERAVETLMSSGPRVLGCVLNRVDYDRNKYYYSRFYGYQYKSYYGRATSAA